MSIDWNPLIQKCHAAAVANGWWEQPRSEDHCMGLVVTEIAEAIEWYRDFKGNADEVFKPYRYDPDADCDILESTCPHMYIDAKPDYWRVWKPTGIPSEFADICIRICDWLGHSSSVGHLPRKQVQRFGADFIADMFAVTSTVCIYSPHTVLDTVEIVAEAYNIDLAAAIETKLAYNATRGHRHGGKRA